MRGSLRSARRRQARRGRRLEERRQALDVHGVVEVGEGAGEHEPVLQRVAGAGRRLGAVGEHPPAPVGPARRDRRRRAEVAPARRRDARAWARRNSGLPATAAAGSRPSPTSLPVAVDVGEHRLHQAGALIDAGARASAHSASLDDQRQRAERPGMARARRHRCGTRCRCRGCAASAEAKRASISASAKCAEAVEEPQPGARGPALPRP